LALWKKDTMCIDDPSVDFFYENRRKEFVLVLQRASKLREAFRRTSGRASFSEKFLVTSTNKPDNLGDTPQMIYLVV
jgi:hypothetical protein